MIEDWAMKLPFMGPFWVIASAWFFSLSGFIAALIARRGKILSVSRLPNLIWTALITLFAQSLTFLWLLTIPAVRHGVLWVLIAVVYAGIFASGAAHGVLSHARSVNAYGDGRRAWMGAVPGANFVLWFKRPLDWATGARRGFALNAGGVVLVVLLCTLGAAGGRLAQHDIQATAKALPNDPARLRAGLDLALRGQGLATTLRHGAARVTRKRLDAVTTILRAESDGTTLRYFYELSDSVAALSVAAQAAMLRHDCTAGPIGRMIEAGATIEFIYRHPDGAEVATIIADRQRCTL